MIRAIATEICAIDTKILRFLRFPSNKSRSEHQKSTKILGWKSNSSNRGEKFGRNPPKCPPFGCRKLERFMKYLVMRKFKLLVFTKSHFNVNPFITPKNTYFVFSCYMHFENWATLFFESFFLTKRHSE